ncbi:MAG: Cyclic di-GMP phosphodiesterase Gmr [Pelotomaculum sp. PtaU1.Bin035]|nr:MAG: Cyclic di-GMP phosphodiesterase Gmr [Pelotomaculum sp. PtaU1.Bin035]
MAVSERESMSSISVAKKSSLILVVDDSKYMRFKLRQSLESDGYTVIEAENGLQALAIYEQLQPEIILMDCIMPLMDGFTACTKLQELPGGDRVPVIMITSLDDDKDVDLAFEAGATDYITKPIHWAVLRHRVRRLLYTRHTEASLDMSEAFTRTLINYALDGIITINARGVIQSLNPAAIRIFGYTSGDVIGQDIKMLMPRFYSEYGSYPAVGKPTGENLGAGAIREVTGCRKDGSTLTIELTISEFYFGERWLFTVILRDITERKRAKEALLESEERYRALTENTYDLISEISNDGRFLYTSPNYKDVLGYEPGELINRSVVDFVHQEDYPALRASFRRVFEHYALGQVIYRFMHKNGELLWFESTGKNYRTATDESRVVFVSRDITERQRYAETIRHQAFHDAVTGLPNRMLFKDRLTLAMAHAKRNKQMLGVLFLDLDRFKIVNDTLGHDVGDQLLKSVARRLTNYVREDDTIARFGGDEFTVLLPEITQAESVAKIAQKILEAIREPFNIDDHELYIATSIGIALYPNDGEDAETLLKNADTAMYRAKEKGKNNYQLYTPAMNARAFERLAMENGLRRALERGEFLVYYQPKVNINTGKIVGMEALVRWQTPDRGLIPPGEFIPLAEDTGLIVPIGEWVLRTACTQNKAWQDAGFTPMRVAVNLSARQFQLQDLVGVVSRVLKDTGLDPQWLELEITESVAMQNAEYAVKMLHELKEMGIQLAIDDFGTGYSSLSYLKRFPINKLKIDKSFVNEIGTALDNSAIASTVIVLGQSLKLGVVAEGVETEEQFDFLRLHQCDEMQGYLFGKPVPPEKFEKLLEQDVGGIINESVKISKGGH